MLPLRGVTQQREPTMMEMLMNIKTSITKFVKTVSRCRSGPRIKGPQASNVQNEVK